MSRSPQALVLALGLVLLTSACGDDDGYVDGTTVIHTTADGIDLQASFLRANSADISPTLLLLHQPGPGHSRHDFDRIWTTLRQAGFGLLAPDLRSHGLSHTDGPIEELAYDSTRYPEDVRAWLDFLEDRADAGDNIDRARVGILGLGTGGSLAAAALGKGYVSCAVSVSPRLAEINILQDGFPRGAQVPEGLVGEPSPEDATSPHPDLEFERIRWMSAVGDSPSAEDAAVLFEASAEPTTHIESTGAFHGEELLMISEDNRRMMVEWCLEHL